MALWVITAGRLFSFPQPMVPGHGMLHNSATQSALLAFLPFSLLSNSFSLSKVTFLPSWVQRSLKHGFLQHSFMLCCRKAAWQRDSGNRSLELHRLSLKSDSASYSMTLLSPCFCFLNYKVREMLVPASEGRGEDKRDDSCVMHRTVPGT